MSAILLQHPLAIPFETLDPLLKRPVRLDLASIERKIVRDGRGGWCFEQNLLLRHVLECLGFHVTGHAARVLWGAPEGVVLARTHMLLRIDLDDVPYIADVGFGGLTLTGPLRLTPDVEQATPHETFRLIDANGDFVLQVFGQGAWKPLYTFDLQPQRLVDYELANWHLCHHPESPFVSNLMAARVTPDCRYGLFNNKLSTHPRQGDSEQHVLTSPAELRETLTTVFGIRLPDEAGLDSALDRLTGESVAR